MSILGLIRCVLISNKSAINALKPCSCVCQTQLEFVRGFRRPHVRKPIYLGTAKSKLLRFPKHKPYKLGEREELQKLSCDYRHAMKSIFAHYKQEYAKISETSHIAAAKQKADDEEWARLMEENRLENERIAKMRDSRVAAYEQERQDRLLSRFVIADEEAKLKLEKAEELVLKVQEKVGTCITLETLDDAIEKAMATEVDYNYAIDLDGNVYRGRYTTELKTPEKSELQA